MDPSALVVLRCCSADVAIFARTLARAMRIAHPARRVLVETADGDVMWRPPSGAPTVAVRLVFICGETLNPARLELPETSRPIHRAAVVVGPDGRDPAHFAQAVALPRVFADVVGVNGAAAMLHGILDNEEREEDRDTEEWLAPEEDGGFGDPSFGDSGGVPSWPSAPDSPSGLDAFRAPAERASRSQPRDAAADAGAAPPTSVATPAPVTSPAAAPSPAWDDEPVRAPNSGAEPQPPAPPTPPPPPRAAAKADAPPFPPFGHSTPTRAASPVGKVAGGLKKIAGAVEGFAATVMNDWILRAPPDAAPPSPVTGPPPVPSADARDATTSDRPAPVSLGASAPRTAAPGGEFTARFIAHVPGRETAVATQLSNLSPGARSHLGIKQCQWAFGTTVTVTLRARGLQVEPAERRFAWSGDQRIEEFDVTVPPDHPPGPVVLKFDASIEGVVVATLRIDLVVTTEVSAIKARTSATASAARTAFASYASGDRARVLDRIAAVRISAGLDVFVDCLSLHPNEPWRERIDAEIRGRDLFLLFWSASAAGSAEVAWEWQTARTARGLEGVQLHPLDPDVPPPAELSDRHAGDAAMWARRAATSRSDA